MVSQLEPGLNRQKLLFKRPVGTWCDLSSRLPSGLVVSFDGVVGGNGVAGEVFCTRRKNYNKLEDRPDDKGEQRDEEEGGLPSIRSSIRL